MFKDMFSLCHEKNRIGAPIKVNTDNEVRNMKLAESLVDEAGVAADLRPIAFQTVLARLSDVDSGESKAGTNVTGKTTSSTQSSLGLDGVASKLGVSRQQVDRVFDIDESGLHVVIAPSRFSAGVMDAMEDIAVLTIAGRQAAGIDEEWTRLDAVRDTCKDRGQFSSGNFAKAIKRLDGSGFRIKGSGANREVKANAVGFETAGKLVDTYSSS